MRSELTVSSREVDETCATNTHKPYSTRLRHSSNWHTDTPKPNSVEGCQLDCSYLNIYLNIKKRVFLFNFLIWRTFSNILVETIPSNYRKMYIYYKNWKNWIRLATQRISILSCSPFLRHSLTFTPGTGTPTGHRKSSITAEIYLNFNYSRLS